MESVWVISAIAILVAMAIAWRELGRSDRKD